MAGDMKTFAVVMNGEHYHLSGSVELSNEGGVDIMGGFSARAGTLVATIKMRRRGLSRLACAIEGCEWHRSLRVAKRRQRRARRDRKRAMRRRLDSHLRRQREAAYGSAVAQARETGKAVDVELPETGQLVTVTWSVR